MAYSSTQSPGLNLDDIYASDDEARKLINKKLERNSYYDIDLKFTKNPNTGDISARKGRSSVRQSIMNLVLTDYYEITFKPEVCCGVKQLLFEPMDFVTERRIEESITNAIQNFEPRADFLEVRVKADQINLGYEITITFAIVNSTEKENITTFLSTTRGV